MEYTGNLYDESAPNHKGKQYVSVLSGLGGGASSRRETAGKVLPGGTLWTFAVMD